MPVAIPLALAAIQTGIGIVKGISDKKKQTGLLSQMQPYKTPQEIYDVLHATENKASQGYDPATLNYLTNQTDQAFASSTGAAERLGADPNTLSAIFSQKLDSMMKIGAENHNLNMNNFSQYLNALNSVGANKAAEQKSNQDLVKNRLQAVGVDLNTDNTNISGGINTALAAYTAYKTGNLYNKKPPKKTTGLAVDNTNQSPTYDSNTGQLTG